MARPHDGRSMRLPSCPHFMGLSPVFTFRLSRKTRARVGLIPALRARPAARKALAAHAARANLRLQNRSGEATMLKFPRRKFLHLAAGAAALPAVSRVASAQTYPTRPVRIIVPV